jgi:torulene dioxygenase
MAKRHLSTVSCILEELLQGQSNASNSIGAGRFVILTSEDGSKPPAILQHFFDGLAILHRFRFVDGEVFYSSRHTAEGIVEKSKKDGYLTTSMFGLNPNTALKDAQRFMF